VLYNTINNKEKRSREKNKTELKITNRGYTASKMEWCWCLRVDSGANTKKAQSPFDLQREQETDNVTVNKITSKHC